MNYMIYLDFVGLVFTLVALVLALRIVWRVEKKLDTFFKIFSIAIALMMLTEIIDIVLHVNLGSPNFYTSLIETIPVIVLTIGLVVMNKLVREMDGEK